MKKLSPAVYSRKEGRAVPAWEVYEQVMELLDKKTDDSRIQSIIDRYRERVLGKSCVDHSPPEYWVIALVTDLHMSLTYWNELPILERAKIMARHYLSNMVSVIDAHYREADESFKRNQAQLQSKDKYKEDNDGED